MIARRWHGRVPRAKATEYLHLMQTVAIPDYRSIPGNRSAWCLHREEGDFVHIEMLTFWDDLDVIKGFAGENIDVAKYYDFDDAFLMEKELHVVHFAVTEC